MEMVVRNAELEDMKHLGHIMAVSFRTAFFGFCYKANAGCLRAGR